MKHFLLFLSLSVSLCLQSQDFSNSPWHIEANNIDPNNYYGITVANGMVGMVSSAEPLKVSEVILNGVYDYYQRGRVSNILKTFSHMNMHLEVDGSRIDRKNISNYKQTLDMKKAKLNTTFDVGDKITQSVTAGTAIGFVQEKATNSTSVVVQYFDGYDPVTNNGVPPSETGNGYADVTQFDAAVNNNISINNAVATGTYLTALPVQYVRPTNFGYHYALDPRRPINTQADTVNNPGGYKNAVAILEKNRDAIVQDVLLFLDEQSTSNLNNGGFGDFTEVELTLTGNVTFTRGDTVTQAGSGVVGKVKNDSTNNSVIIVGPNGIFDTSGELSVGGVSKGADSVPASVATAVAFTWSGRVLHIFEQ